MVVPLPSSNALPNSFVMYRSWLTAESPGVKPDGFINVKMLLTLMWWLKSDFKKLILILPDHIPLPHKDIAEKKGCVGAKQHLYLQL